MKNWTHIGGSCLGPLQNKLILNVIEGNYVVPDINEENYVVTLNIDLRYRRLLLSISDTFHIENRYRSCKRRYRSRYRRCMQYQTWTPVSAGMTDRDLACTQFPRN
jgi:hypothetical protein